MTEYRATITRGPHRFRRRRALAVMAGVLLAGGAAAHGGLRAITASADAARAIAPPAPVGYEAQEHFPGAAYDYAAEADAAPAPGVTGTTALPALPAGAAMLTAGLDGTVIPAAATAFSGRTVLDGARALECLTAAIYYEAASESDEGQRAVAQVILNRARHPAFPASICGVVYQGSERITGCQFSFSCDGAMARAPSRSGWLRARRIAAAALAGSVYAPVGLATHYHTFAVRPSWNKGLVMTDAIGAHFFHRWKGWWGTPAAFSQRYAGIEPFPGPKRPIAAQMAALAAPGLVAPGLTPFAAGQSQPLFALPPAMGKTPSAQIQPDYVRSGDALPGTAAAITPDSQIRDAYKDSGSWIGG